MSRFEHIEFMPPSVRKLTVTDDTSHDEDRSPIPDSSHWMREADRERREGHFEGALRNYSRALEFDRSTIDAWVGQVQMLVLLDELPEAELWSRKALELFPQEGNLVASRAQTLIRLENRALARELSDRSLERAGETAYRWMVRGEVLMAEGEPSADHCFQRSEACNRDWLVGAEIALICRRYGMTSKAITFLRDSLQTAADQAYVWYLLGECQADLEMTGAARRSFECCLELVPHHAAAEASLTNLSYRTFSLTRWLRRCWC